MWDEGCAYVSDGVPINTSEERMGLDNFYRESMLLRDNEARRFEGSGD